MVLLFFQQRQHDKFSLDFFSENLFTPDIGQAPTRLVKIEIASWQWGFQIYTTYDTLRARKISHTDWVQ